MSTRTALTAPLSVAQEALWYTQLLAPASVAYNESVQIHKDGPLELEPLRRAFAEIVRRHEAWRTTFDVAGGHPLQVVGPAPSLPLEAVDLSELTREEAERHAARLTGRIARVPYDLRHSPLVRPRLITFPGEHHRLVLAMHHLAFDGVCVSRVVLPELVTLYDAFRAGRPARLADPQTQYRDYARWEQEWITSSRVARRFAHWRRRLHGMSPSELVLDRPRPARRRFRGAIVPVSLPAETVRAARALGHRSGATLFQVLAAVWALVLRVYSGQDEVVFATAADLRQRREFEAVVGYCLTSLVLRVDVGGDPTFSEFLLRVRNELLDGLENLVPFERLVRELGHERIEDANPIFRTMIILEPEYQTPDPSWSLHQLASDVDAAVGGSKLDLELQLDERPDGHIEGRLIYDLDLYEAATAEAIARHWLGLIEAVLADPMLPLSTLGEAAPRGVTVEFNATRTAPAWPSLADALSESLHRHADRNAVGSLTYGGLREWADALALRLAAGGVGPGDVVAILAPPAPSLVAGALAVTRLGGAYAALLDLGHTERLLRRSHVRAVLAASGFEGKLGADVQEVSLACEPSSDGFDVGSPDAGSLCCVERAAVALPHRALVNAAVAVASEVGLGPADTVLVFPETAARAHAVALWAPLLAGARIVFAPPAAAGADVSRLIAEEDVTFVPAPPVVWQRLLDTGLRTRRGLRALAHGEPLPSELAAQLHARCRTLWNAYGTAETAGVATLALVEPNGPVTIGRPIANVRAYVVDEHGRPLPLGAVGEIVLAGDGLGRPLDGAAGFVEEPMTGRRALRTGDRARWLAGGELMLVAAP